jgi:tetratricopeptide (TPR) repeat protein
MSRPLNSQLPTQPLKQLPRPGRWRFWKFGIGSWELRVVVCVFTLFVSGCETRREPEPQSQALQPVSLPDLSQMDKAVQQQIGDKYRSLQSLVESRSAPPQNLARAYGDVGNLLMAADDLDAAEEYYLHAQALDPSEMRWPYYLGHVYMNRAAPAKSIASFERALRLRPDDVATLVWLGNVYLDHGQPELAEMQFTRALSAQPRVVAALFGQGRAALAQREYSRAVNYFDQVLAADPRASMTHYPLALAYRGLGDTARAEAHLSQQGTVEVGPPDPLMAELRGLLEGAVAEENRGVRALDSGDFKTAAEHFRKGVALAPDNPAIRHKLGTALSLMGDMQGAVEQFQETVRRSPGFAQAHYSLGVLMAVSGRRQEALESFSTAVKYEPGYVEARLRLADLMRQSGRPDAALIQYAQVMTIDPRAAEAQFGYAMALVQLKRYDEARRRLTEGMSLHPERREFADALAKLDELRGRQ